MSEPIVIEAFAGPGGWSEGLRLAGFTGRAFGIEHDWSACKTATTNGHQRVQADVAAFPIEHLAGLVDGVIESPPCFPAGAPVVTARGVIAIEDVRVGDLVLTHKNRWRPVTATMSRQAPVYADRWLAATADHRFLTRPQVRYWDNEERQRRWRLGEAEWTAAGQMHGAFVGIPQDVESLSMPTIAGRPVECGEPFWYMIGRWLGDGWVRSVEPDPAPPAKRTAYSAMPRDCRQCGSPATKHARYDLWTAYCGPTCKAQAGRQRRRTPRAEILLCCGNHEADGLAQKLADTGMTWTRSQERTTTRFTAAHTGLTRWLIDNFGRYAHGKTLPGWLLGAPRLARQAVLDGYLAADGSATTAGWSASTVSQNLAFGLRVLATSLGYVTSLVSSERRTHSTIEGRVVAERPQWHLRINPDDGRYTRSENGHRWVKRRQAMTYRGDETVYDLTVDEDHSFVAYGFAVHNCTTFSNAGHGAGNKLTALLITAITRTARGHKVLAATRRACAAVLREVALADPKMRKWTRAQRSAWARKQATISVLVVQPIRWAYILRPRWIALEQVPSVLPLWTHTALMLRELGYKTWVGVLSAEEYGVPQTRKRAVLVARNDGLPVGPPEPTHQPYRAGQQAETQPNLFGDPLPPPVSMADALGWSETATVEFQRGRGMAERHGERPHRPAVAPAPTVRAGIGGVGANLLVHGQPVLFERQQNGGVRTAEEPSLTVLASHDNGNLRWSMAPAGAASRLIEPRPTAQTRRVTVDEVAAFQSFRPDFQWYGTKSKRHEQAGNAVPPLLAAAVLRQFLRR